jgi:hypothetical protein
MRRFAFDPNGGIAYDFNRDGLLDVVHAGGVLLNERRATNRPPVADAGPDRTYEFRDHINDDEWCERTTPSFDPDLHRVLADWRDETGTQFGCAMPPHAPGTYTFTLTVRDDLGASSSDTMRVTIRPAPEIVLHPGHAWDRHGNWMSVTDPEAASGVRLYHPNSGAAKSSAPAVSPTDYVDLWFAADPTQTYKLWVRLKADGNYWGNDSVWLQFDGTVASDGSTYALGSTRGLPINLEECSGCGISGWGWEDDGWGASNRNGVTLRFPQGGIRRIRVQVREDGVSIHRSCCRPSSIGRRGLVPRRTTPRSCRRRSNDGPSRRRRIYRVDGGIGLCSLQIVVLDPHREPFIRLPALAVPRCSHSCR